ncbi:MAG: protein jag [Actinomycetes bacterium]|uniref:Jag family protein n=1 Tax=Arthrobacter subterraneus TaxID=335973 RepID=UPI003817EE9F
MSTDNMQEESLGTVNEEEAEGNAVVSSEDEGDVAADYLEELLDIADIDGDIDIEVRNGRTYISIVSEGSDAQGLQALVGRDGEVLEALQELARLSVLTSTEHRSRLVLDIDGFREARNKELREIAEEAVDKVKESGADVALAPMSAYERKIVHDIVADLGMVSESEGEGSRRHIVVSAGS